MPTNGMTTRLDVQRRGTVAVKVSPGRGCYLAERTAAEQAEIFRAGIEAQKADGDQNATITPYMAAAVHDDRLYRGYNHALRCQVNGRTHEREILRERGLVHCG